MRKILFTIISTLLLSIFGQAQNTNLGSYLDFEITENGFPVSWYTDMEDSLNYKVSIDSTIVKHGKYAAAIEFTGENIYKKYLLFTLPENYDGKRITLSGYLKTENITEGYAGLVMAIAHRVTNFRNQPEIITRDEKTRITGTTDWTKYEITLDMNPVNTRNISFGAKLSGNGKMWLDDLKITIDGNDIQTLEPFIPTPFPAENDKEFDDGSLLVFPDLDKQKSDNLELLGRIWGFLKYHHPAIAKGIYNWDYELFRLLHGYLEANNNMQRDSLLLDWINALGEVPDCESCQPSDNVFLQPDLSWIGNSNMNQVLKNKLQHIYQNRYQGHHYYVMLSYFNSPLFLNENNYAAMPYPDAGFRLLALYRYWNMVYYFYPSKYLTDKDWNDVLGEYIPYFIEAKDELEYGLVALRLTGEICDSHAADLMSDKVYNSRGNRFAPFRVGFIENKLVVTDYYSLRDTVLTNDEIKDKTGLLTGDIITHINGKPVEAIIDSIRIYYPASNEATRRNRNIAFDLLRSNEQIINVNYITSGQTKQKNIETIQGRYLSGREFPQCYRLLEQNINIGYIHPAFLKDEDIPIIKKEFKNTEGIIIDLRTYPSLAGQLLSPWFVLSDTIFIKYTQGNPNNPGEFVFTRRETDFIQKAEETYPGKVVVLVNEETQSEGEYQAISFRTGWNTTVIGSQTAGALGRISEISFPGGIDTWISGVGIYYPDGTQTQRIGVVPDIEVNPTIQGIQEGRDELLDKAIEIILQQ
ncbi:MAG: peptidase S41 [Tannerella sp.]|jgi:C-terminal processing protease CtpA/Prc|nr:peptidase S41 [Tannerella sp.]